MATETRPGFRLPWAAAADEAEGQDVEGDAPVAEETQEPDMIETTEAVEVAEVEAEAAASADAPEPVDEGGSQPARRATKFMAELSRAMQAAAENSRGETMARFEAEAKGVVEDIHARATDEAADLRRKADDDVAAVREWSKAEIARIREETETRIAARKSGLDAEVEQHGGMVEARIERVATVVSAFEGQMAAFFERLNAEEDPTRIATMAETMPDPPSLVHVVAAMIVPAPASEPPSNAAAALANGPMTDADFAAAEAEALSFSGDLETDDDEPATGENEPIEANDTDEPAATAEGEPTDPTDLVSTRVIVTGLVSVANIANFKRSLTRTPGVATIAVASGPDGDFIFTVGHSLGAGLSASVQALSGFGIQITGDSGDAINVAAQDREATD
jgi:hypothetical protein